MAELKSLAEIKLEVDLIMVDIEVLGEIDKEEAIKYLETSLEELKQVNNWEIPCVVNSGKTETREEIEEKSNDDEVDNIACKRLKLEITTETDDTLNQNEVNAETNPISELNTKIVRNDQYSPIISKVETIKSEGTSYEENDKMMTEDHNVADHGGYIENHSHPLASEYSSQTEDRSDKMRNQDSSEDQKYDGANEQDVSNNLPTSVSDVGEIKTEISTQVEDIYSTYPQHVYSDQNPEREQTEDTLLREWGTAQNFGQQYDHSPNPHPSFSNVQYPNNGENTGYYEEGSDERLPSRLDPSLAPESSEKTSISSHVLYNGKVPTCTECNITFPSLGVLDNHLRNGHKQNTLFNRMSRGEPTSRQVYTRNYDVNSLGIRTNEDGTFQCTICDSKSKYKYNMKLHMNRHVNRNEIIPQPELPISNQLAGLDYYEENEEMPTSSDQSLYAQDGKSEHLLNEDDSHGGANYSMDYSLEEYEQHLPQDTEVAPAPHAPLGYDISQPQFNRNRTHARTLSNDQKSYPCELCEQSFTKSDYLKRHMISHSDRFKCKTCGAGFTEQGRLNRHLQRRDNCNKYLAKRVNDETRKPSWPQHTSYPSNEDWMRNSSGHQVDPQNFPPGIQITKKVQPSLQSSFRNPILAEQFLNNPNLSVQIKTEPSNQF